LKIFYQNTAFGTDSSSPSGSKNEMLSTCNLLCRKFTAVCWKKIAISCHPFFPDGAAACGCSCRHLHEL